MVLAFICTVALHIMSAGHAAENPSSDDSDDEAKKKSLAGHSYHGEAFNEGPRQRAYLMGSTGNVKFAVTTENEEAQRFFNQGVGQLHGFWYFEAERSFRQVGALDPECAMAYWGMAMASFENEGRARGFITEATKRRDAASDREKSWIDGYAAYLKEGAKNRNNQKKEYIKSLEELVHEYPEDLEAKAFLLVRLWQFKGDLPIVSHLAVNALLSEIFAAQPDHPAQHYRIHLWDRSKPEVALDAASRCGQNAPGIAHMWHMPGHIFSKLHRYADAAWQQEASARVDHAHMMRDRVLPDQIHNYAHNNEWLIRNLNHLGRVRDALDLAKNMIELPRHPKYNSFKEAGRSATYGRARLLETLERFELWEELIDLSRGAYLEPTDEPRHQVRRLAALGRAHLGRGDQNELDALLEDVRTRIADLERRQREIKAVEEDAEKEDATGDGSVAEGDKGKDVDGDGDGDGSDDKNSAEGDAKEEKLSKKELAERLGHLRPLRKELRTYTLILRGENDFAREMLEELDGITELHRARLLARIGHDARAEEVLESVLEDAENEVAPTAALVHVLWRSGKTEEARETFESLRTMAVHADLDTPPFQRLRECAHALGLPEDFRIKPEPAMDVGERPALDSLGSFRWSPSSAPAWNFPKNLTDDVSLESYRGKPLVLIFYLGAGCLHCVEQIKKFSPRLADLQEAGLEVVAISTEKKDELRQALINFKDAGEDPGFPLLSNGELDVFKAYGCYDDFEDQPLHGTFLIDGRGMIRWQDISYEPFNDVDFLLGEARRVLQGGMAIGQRRLRGF
jgi:peroxiredoxin/tetratricopeptide (TPR) repeat protein